MVDEGYRDELGAAHVRIAQLEEQLAAREAADNPVVKRLESARAELSAGPPRTLASWGLGVFAFVLALPLALIQLRYDGTLSALLILAGALAFAVLAGALTRWVQQAQRRSALAAITGRLEDARRMQRLEAEVADLRAARAERPNLRVGDEVRALDQAAEDAPDVADDLRESERRNGT